MFRKGLSSHIILRKLNRLLSMNTSQDFNFLNGKRVPVFDSLRSIENYNPATGSLLYTFQCSGEKDVNEAVNSAQDAFCSWSRKSPRERGKILCSAASIIRTKLEEIAVAEVRDTGKPIWEARVDIAGCADALEYYGGMAATIRGYHHNLSDHNFAMVQREPFGVVGGIGAWNYPFQVMSWKVAPAIVSGNTFVYKPSEFTPTTSVLLAEIFTQAGLPSGVISVLQGGYETGELMCAHPGISNLTFTGSVATGQKIVKSCADTMKKVTLELGGKSSLLVFSDCQIKNAVKATLIGNFLTQGEVCTNCTRVFVQKDIFDPFLEQLVAATKKLKVGDPFLEDTTVGAVISEAHGNKILDYINSARLEGAVVCGGERLKPADMGGFFLSPCILTGCSDQMRAVREEIFGPVVCILPFDCEEEALARANSTPYGLAAGVMTRDVQRAHRVASRLEAGIVWINNYNVFPAEVPFGGCKMSGYGRENGLAAIDEFTRLKTVYVEMNQDIDCPIYRI